jgi:ribosome-binding ATPase YchF (GTP1/OBG family)
MSTRRVLLGNAQSDCVAENARGRGARSVTISAAIEAEVAQLADADEKREFLDALGLDVPDLARVIRAETIAYADFAAYGGEMGARDVRSHAPRRRRLCRSGRRRHALPVQRLVLHPLVPVLG